MNRLKCGIVKSFPMSIKAAKVIRLVVMETSGAVLMAVGCSRVLISTSINFSRVLSRLEKRLMSVVLLKCITWFPSFGNASNGDVLPQHRNVR